MLAGVVQRLCKFCLCNKGYWNYGVSITHIQKDSYKFEVVVNRMSIYGSVLFERKHEKMLKGMKGQDTLREVAIFLDSLTDSIQYDIRAYNKAQKPSRKVCRLRDIFCEIAYNRYHYYTDETCVPDRVQMYHFGKMEIFV